VFDPCKNSLYFYLITRVFTSPFTPFTVKKKSLTPGGMGHFATPQTAIPAIAGGEGTLKKKAVKKSGGNPGLPRVFRQAGAPCPLPTQEAAKPVARGHQPPPSVLFVSGLVYLIR
jgi:hypothetical protein